MASQGPSPPAPEALTHVEQVEQLLAQMRAVNEQLMIATLRAEQLAEEAEAGRAAAAENADRFRTLIAASSALVFTAAESGRITFDRDGWHAFTGNDGDWLDAVHAADHDRVTASWARVLESATIYECEHRLRRSDGTYAWVAARAVPIMRAGVAREWIGMLTDISQRVGVERAREQFIAILSHDLRAPLSAISIGADALEGAPMSPPYDRVAAEIGKTARRMEALVHDVMDFARGRLGSGIPISPVACDLGALCGDVVGEVTRVHPGRSIRYAVHGCVEGTWDPDRLAQVVSNLLDNAIQHGADPIDVLVTGDGPTVVLSVANRGRPIPEATLASLFEPFVESVEGDGRVQAARTGLGLGLYIVKEIVRAHGGTIEVTSDLASGTAFIVQIPR